MNPYQNTMPVEDAFTPGTPSQVWGKLVSLNSNLENFPLTKSIYTIGRGNGNDITINDIRLSNVHCILTKDNNDMVFLEDVSSNGTYVENEKIGKRNSKILLPGENIYLLHNSKVQAKDILGFTFSFVINNTSPYKRTREYEEDEIPEVTLAVKQVKLPKTLEKTNESIKCCQCEQKTHHLITALPCRHTFCHSCYGNWMDKSENCPKCCEEVQQMLNETMSRGFRKAFIKEEDETKEEKGSFMEQEHLIPSFKHKESNEDSFSRVEMNTAASTNENSRSNDGSEFNERSFNYTKRQVEKMQKYCALIDKFTAS